MYGKTFKFQKRKSLFNLYSFTQADSLKKEAVPTLVLRNIEVRNLLAGYDSLVHVESDNFEVATDIDE